MKQDERARRHENLHRAVLNNDGVVWLDAISSLLSKAYESHQQRDIMSVPRLQVDGMCEHFKASAARLFILNYEGTLAATGSHANSKRAVEVLRELMFASHRNIVYVTSALQPEELEQLFQQLPGIGLIAENGGFVRPFCNDFSSEGWIDLVEVHSPLWKESLKNVLQYYVERIEGSEIEERHCSLILRYDNVSKADFEAAEKLAGDCANHINDSCKNLGVRAIPVDRTVQIELKHIDRRRACQKVLSREQLRLGEKIEDDADAVWMRAESSQSGALSPYDSTTSPGRGRSRTGSRAHSRSQSRLESCDPQANTKSSSRVLLARKPSRTHGHTHTTSRSPLGGDDELLSASGSPPSGVTPCMADSGYTSEDFSPTRAHAAPATGPQFLMVAGDGREDEAVFRWADRLGKHKAVNAVFTVSVGKRQTTEAKATLTQGVPGLLKVLGKLAEVVTNNMRK